MKTDQNKKQSNVQFCCPVCSFDLWLPLAKLEVSVLGLYDDARFPGRCILVLDGHAEDFSILDPQLACRFFRDCQVSAKAIKAAVNVKRVNVAILGNEVAHVHFHLIPRRPSDEPIPNRPPWEHPQPKSPLSEIRRLEISSRIKEELSKLG